tara:strand:- start:260 stop:568 length:309 start_codon:yes stop_codon:yes gene_type:complete
LVGLTPAKQLSAVFARVTPNLSPSAAIVSANVGLPDEKWGETVAAVITLSGDREPSLEDVNQFLADRLARYKRPRVLHVTDMLPRNPAGKVQKFAIRDSLAS